MDKEQLSEAKTKQDGIHGDGQKKKKSCFQEFTATVPLSITGIFFFLQVI